MVLYNGGRIRNTNRSKRCNRFCGVRGVSFSIVNDPCFSADRYGGRTTSAHHFCLSCVIDLRVFFMQ